MSSRIVQKLRHPRTGEMMTRIIVDPRGITREEYSNIHLEAIRAFGPDNVRSHGYSLIKEGTNGN